MRHVDALAAVLAYALLLSQARADAGSLGDTAEHHWWLDLIHTSSQFGPANLIHTKQADWP
jgi:hypothetical protein